VVEIGGRGGFGGTVESSGGGSGAWKTGGGYVVCGLFARELPFATRVRPPLVPTPDPFGGGVVEVDPVWTFLR
jgi:hypothetical protein